MHVIYGLFSTRNHREADEATHPSHVALGWGVRATQEELDVFGSGYTLPFTESGPDHVNLLSVLRDYEHRLQIRQYTQIEDAAPLLVGLHLRHAWFDHDGFGADYGLSHLGPRTNTIHCYFEGAEIPYDDRYRIPIPRHFTGWCPHTRKLVHECGAVIHIPGKVRIRNISEPMKEAFLNHRRPAPLDLRGKEGCSYLTMSQIERARQIMGPPAPPPRRPIPPMPPAPPAVAEAMAQVAASMAPPPVVNVADLAEWSRQTLELTPPSVLSLEPAPGITIHW